MFHLNLQERAGFRVKRGFPQLFGVHFAQTFIALNGNAFFAGGHNRINKGNRPRNADFNTVFGNQNRRLGKVFQQHGAHFVKNNRLRTVHNRAADNVLFFHAAQGAVNGERIVFVQIGQPAFVIFGFM